MRRAVAAAALGASLLLAAPAGAAPKTLQTGVMDQAALGSPQRDVWLGRARKAGIERVRLAFGWSAISPTAPPVDQASSAAWPGYRWDAVDAQVRAVVAAGMTPLLSFNGAPAWAQEPGRPNGVVASAWKPDPGAFGRFMRAAAERYSGRFPDPLAPGSALPRVRQFQVWNEPNLDLYLAPQKIGGEPFAPVRFRQLVNAGYAGVKAVQPDATVVAAGLAPFGDPGANPRRTRPVEFLRSMLCLDGALRKRCAEPTFVDVLSHHPYGVDRPGRAAYAGDDATVPDLERLTRVISAARTAGTLGPRRPQLWVTEFGYDSSPPDPKGVPTATRARWISEALWRMWRAGVPAVYWYLLQDQAPTPSFAATYQSGLYVRDGRAKADLRAFRFPLLVTRTTPERHYVWFRTPAAGTVAIQARRGGRWRTVLRRRKLQKDQVVTVRIGRRSGVRAFRGVVGRTTSYAWSLSAASR